MSDDPPLCARCNAEPATEGGLLGDRCRAEVKAQTVDYWYPGRPPGGEPADR